MHQELCLSHYRINVSMTPATSGNNHLTQTPIPSPNGPCKMKPKTDAAVQTPPTSGHGRPTAYYPRFSDPTNMPCCDFLADPDSLKEIQTKNTILFSMNSHACHGLPLWNLMIHTVVAILLFKPWRRASPLAPACSRSVAASLHFAFVSPCQQQLPPDRQPSCC